VIVGVAALAWRQYTAPLGVSPAARAARIGGPFSLVDHQGKSLTEADFSGRYMLIYFGYTFCPDVCPTSLTIMADALNLIGSDADAVVPVFVTVDPERDTPEHLSMYVGHFHPRLVGLTGTAEQVKAAAKVYRVYYAKAREQGADGDDYLVDHTSIVYLMGPDGEFRAHFTHQTDAETMAKKIREFL
jgi:protein SCO1/2